MTSHLFQRRWLFFHYLIVSSLYTWSKGEATLETIKIPCHLLEYKAFIAFLLSLWQSFIILEYFPPFGFKQWGSISQNNLSIYSFNLPKVSSYANLYLAKVPPVNGSIPCRRPQMRCLNRHTNNSRERRTTATHANSETLCDRAIASGVVRAVIFWT